jgi:O-antigen/teichoic acid export membrane protein
MSFRFKIAPWTGRLSLAAAAPLVGFSSRFFRTIFLTHFLAPAEIGVSIAITVVITTSEMISEVGLHHVVLVRSGPEARDFLSAAHMLQLLRGLMISIALAFLCVPLSSMFGIPQLWKSFLVAALIPLMRSFYHLGVYQIQREYEYRPHALSVCISSVAAFGIAMLMVVWIPDHRVILVSLGCEAFLLVILSHLLSPIEYQWRATGGFVREVLKFGLPLTANGLALALISQADRLLVAGKLGVESLAVYAVVVGLAQTPISPIFEIFGTLGMSMMVRSQGSPERQLASFAWLMWLFSLLAFAYAAFVGLTLDFFAPLIYGPHYTVPESWRVFITGTVFLSTYRGAHTVLLLSLGHTAKLAIANATVGLGVLAAVLGVMAYPRPEAILAGKLFGDVVSLAVFHWAVFTSLKSSRRTVLHCLIFSLSSVTLFTVMIWSSPNPTWTTRMLLSAICLLPLSLLLWRAYMSWRTRQQAFVGGALAPQ